MDSTKHRDLFLCVSMPWLIFPYAFLHKINALLMCKSAVKTLLYRQIFTHGPSHCQWLKFHSLTREEIKCHPLWVFNLVLIIGLLWRMGRGIAFPCHILHDLLNIPRGFFSQWNAVHLRESSLPQKYFRKHLSQIADICEFLFKEEMTCVGRYEFGSKMWRKCCSRCQCCEFMLSLPLGLPQLLHL